MVPDEQYYSAIQKLNSYSNVQTVGYVRTGYATRDIDTVIEEVKTYAGWSSNSSSIAMSGIFFDESPHEYSDSAVEYMKNISSTVKGADGLFGDKTVCTKLYHLDLLLSDANIISRLSETQAQYQITDTTMTTWTLLSCSRTTMMPGRAEAPMYRLRQTAGPRRAS